ncbi:MAG: hypothetical protein LRY27_04370 [Chitinophagales bacterium]|nr:hypothetical protein [Chitinophagales bacterium]
MKERNNWQDDSVKLYVYPTLDLLTARMFDPTSRGYEITDWNNEPLSQKEIEINRKEYEQAIKDYKYEMKLFKNFRNGKLKERTLDAIFSNQKINIEFLQDSAYNNFNLEADCIGYLFISRIIFNWNYTKGYMHYTYYCGDACAWDDNIEIQKINGKWIITKKLSGGIA